MSAPTRTNKSTESAPPTSRVIKAGRVVPNDEATATETKAPAKTTVRAKTSAAAKTGAAAAVAQSKPELTPAERAERAARKAAKAARQVDKQARLAARVQEADDEIAREESRGIALGTQKQWLVASVVGVLIFQIVHSSEHVAQVVYWLFNPTAGPWMSTWAMGLTMSLGSVSGGGIPLGMELLHLIGNGIFLAGLLLAARLPERFHNDESRRWLRIATFVQVAHVAEHVLLTTSVAFGGSALGASTLFGLLTPGTPAAVGYRVLFHLAINLVATYFAMRALLASRRVQPSLGSRDGRLGYALLVAPIVGLIFLVPVFGAHAPNSAAADPSVVVATVNGQGITSAELTAEMDNIRSQQNADQLGAATPGTEVVAGNGQELTEDQLRFQTLNRLVQNALIAQSAAELGIVLTDADVEARKVQMISNDFINEQNYENFLTTSNVTEEYADTQIRGVLLEERVHDQLTQGFVASAEDVQSVFAQQYEGLPRAQHLLTQSEELAETFRAQAEAGANFDEMVRNESIDPRAASSNGYMGAVRQGSQVQEVVDAIGEMQDGEYRVVRTQFGWHVILRLPVPTQADVEPEIRANLLLASKASAGQEWLTGIRAAATVSLQPGYGVWDTQFGAVVDPDAAPAGATPAG